MSARHQPVRTCVGCGRRDRRSNLVRIVIGPDGCLRPDPRGSGCGRGAYLHQDQACWEKFARRKGHVRSLRAPVAREQRSALIARLQRSNLELR